MPSPTPTLNPIQNANSWHTFTLGGQQSPGTIPRGGIRGFKRETGWDKKKGKGLQGATLTLKTQPPVEGSIALQLITATDFANWDAFVSNALSISPTKQQAQGLAIYHPQFSSIGLTTVVVKNYSAPEHQGKGMYVATVELIEWAPPPPVNITSTVTATKPDVPDAEVPPPDPRIVALQAQLQTLQRANQTGSQ